MSKTTYDLTEEIKSAIGIEELKNYQKRNNAEMQKDPVQFLLDTAALHNIDKPSLIKNGRTTFEIGISKGLFSSY